MAYVAGSKLNIYIHPTFVVARVTNNEPQVGKLVAKLERLNVMAPAIPFFELLAVEACGPGPHSFPRRGERLWEQRRQQTWL